MDSRKLHAHLLFRGDHQLECPCRESPTRIAELVHGMKVSHLRLAGVEIAYTIGDLLRFHARLVEDVLV